MANKRKAGETLRPYIHADEMQETLLENVSLTVQSAFGKDEISSDTAYLLDRSEIGGAGLTLNFKNSDAIRGSSNKLVNDLDDASIVVVAEDGVTSALRTRQVLWECPVTTLPEQIQLFGLNEKSDRGSVFGHPSGSKHLHVFAVRNKQINTLSPLKPRLKGAVLARITFDIRPNPSFDSVKPQKLDDEIRRRFNLPDNSWYAFNAKPNFLTANLFSDAFEVYLDEEIMRQGSESPGPYKTALDLVFSNLFMTSLIEEAIYYLQQEEEGEAEADETSAVMVWLRSLLGDEFREILTGDKITAISTALAANKVRDRILKLGKELE